MDPFIGLVGHVYLAPDDTPILGLFSYSRKISGTTFYFIVDEWERTHIIPIEAIFRVLSATLDEAKKFAAKPAPVLPFKKES